jgi:hypothetical protein
MDVKVDPSHQQDTLCRVLHYFDLKGFGMNAGESTLCETLPGRNVVGNLMRKKFDSMTWSAM